MKRDGLIHDLRGQITNHREVAALRAQNAELVAALSKADLAIQKAAMAMGSTDEWTDQAAMIGDFEERLAALAAAGRSQGSGE